MASEAVLTPEAVGVKLTLTAQLALAARMAVQVEVLLKSPLLPPVIDIPQRFVGEVPRFARVTT